MGIEQLKELQESVEIITAQAESVLDACADVAAAIESAISSKTA